MAVGEGWSWELREGGNGKKLRLCSSQSGHEHVSQVSVRAVDPEDQREGNGHKGPGDALHTCKQAAAFGAGELLQLSVALQVVPGSELQQLIKQDDGQRDLQHH